MKIMFCAAEASPFARVGGLGDVIGSLPKALAEQGEDVIVCIPYYSSVASGEFPLFETAVGFTTPYQGKTYPFRILESKLPRSSVPIYFFDNSEIYGSIDEIYPEDRPEFEAFRFDLFGKGVFQFLKQISFQPDIMHVHDWHTSSIPLYLKETFSQDPFFKHTKAVLTVHNMAYQGITGNRNRLKEGILYSDAIVAVSNQYSKEILTPNGGAGLQEIVRTRENDLYGILNGIDMELFNPASDVFIPRQYDVTTVKSGKAICKAALQMEIGLEITQLPLFGMVTRLVEQKGMEIFIEALPRLAMMPLQFAILGIGHQKYEAVLREMNSTTANIRSMAGFNMALGQHIYAGSDLFLMPSRFEPCGLGHMIAFRYGTVPLVRKTGGLADTVFDIDKNPETGNGFLFEDYTADALVSAVKRAVLAWQKHDSSWWAMVERGMTQDLSWSKSAREYQKVYQKVCQKVRQEAVERS